MYSFFHILGFFAEGDKVPAARIPLSGNLRLDIDQFDCHNRIMTGEFKKTLQYSRYPQLTVRFINLEKRPSFTPTPIHPLPTCGGVNKK